MKSPIYTSIFEHYEKRFAEHGDNHKGMDWPNLDDALVRYQVMWELTQKLHSPKDTIEILDVGCGIGHFLEYLRRNQYTISYQGLDISETFIDHCRQKFPTKTFYHCDLLKNPFDLHFDYVTMNGVFTEKVSLSYSEMTDFFESLITKVFEIANIGISFNVMSSHVDWEREDLFHLPMDEMAKIIIKNLTRNFQIRNDYGLYEYTVYIYK